MDRLYIIVGILALSLASGASGITISPASQGSCCGLLKYEVTLANPNPLVQKAFAIEALSLDSGYIWVSLEPDAVVVPAGGEEKLVMFVRAECGTAPGEYKIRVSATCMQGCAETSERAEAVLSIPASCAPAQPQPDTQPDNQPDTQPKNNVVVINPNGNAGTPSKPKNNVVIIAPPNAQPPGGGNTEPTGALPAAGEPPEGLIWIVLAAVIIAAIVGTVAWIKSR